MKWNILSLCGIHEHMFVQIFMIKNAKFFLLIIDVRFSLWCTDTFVENCGNSLDSVAQINPSNNIVSSILLSLLTLLSFWSPLLSYIVRWLIMPYCVIYILPFICWFSSTFHRDVNHFTLLVCFHQNNSI